MANKKDTDSVKIIDASVQERKNKSKKTAVVITYVIAMLALWAGLFVPLFGTGGEIMDRMMFRYLPSIFNACLFGVIDKNIIPDLGNWFLTYESMHDAFGVDYIAVLYTLYALMCVLSVIFLIPVCAGNRNKRTSAGCAFFIEILSILILGGALYFALQTFVIAETFNVMNLVIPFGVCAFFAIIQSIALKGGLGVHKTFTFLIAGIAALALFDISAIIPALATPLDKLSELVKAGNAAGLITDNGIPVFGYEYLIEFSTIKEVFNIGDIVTKIAVISVMVYCALLVFNLAIETIALGNGRKYKPDGTPVSNGGHNAFAIIRYLLTLIAGGLATGMFFAAEGYTPGVYLYITLALTLILFIFAIARTAIDRKRVAKGKLPIDDGKSVHLFDDDADFATIGDEFITPVVVRDVPPPIEAAPDRSAQQTEALPPVAGTQETATAEVYAQPAAPGEPQQLTMLEPEKKVVYTYKAVYDGPTDAFISTLEDSEKIEFVQTFLEKSKCKLNGIPDYVIGGDNSEFFPAIFVHLNKFRNILSDGLMAKIYRQL